MRLSLANAFAVPLLCGEVGIPFIGMEMISHVGHADQALQERIADQRRAYRDKSDQVAMRILDVERILQRSELVAPSRPSSYVEYTAWGDAACHAVLEATGPHVAEGALAAFGRALVDVLLPINLGAMILQLRAVAPDHEELRACDEHLLERLTSGTEHLGRMSKFSTLPNVARVDAEQLAGWARLALLFDPAKRDMRQAGLNMMYRSMSERAQSLSAKLAG